MVTDHLKKKKKTERNLNGLTPIERSMLSLCTMSRFHFDYSSEHLKTLVQYDVEANA